jgi:hypothetical protein
MSLNALQSPVIYCLFAAGVARCGYSIPKAADGDSPKTQSERVSSRLSAQQPVTVEFAELAVASEPCRPFSDSILPPRAMQLSGSRVRLVGYFHLGSLNDDLHEFTLVDNYTHNTPTYDPDEIVIVHLRNGDSARATYNQITVEGTFDVESLRSAGELIAIYHLRDAIIAVADGPRGVARPR